MDIYEFEPVTIDEMRQLWKTHRNPQVRRLLLELNRMRHIQDLIHESCDIARKVFAQSNLGRLAALEEMHYLIVKERQRVGDIGRLRK
ncbi:MAG: hypothetical protein M3O74_13775 [Pseudomonadota bacterium]|nr:hypothetical protein [Pseudomonadota bacterium]